MLYDLSGLWTANIGDGKEYEMELPGTLDENQIGHPDTGANQWHPDAELGNADKRFDEKAPIATRFTRKYTFEGEARIRKNVTLRLPKGKRFFLEIERARCLRLVLNGQEIPHWVEGTISTPHIFEVTEVLYENVIAESGDAVTVECDMTLLSDNSYPRLPHDAIVYSSAATDETQTNWNGILGYFHIRQEEPVFISGVRVYPTGNKAAVHVEVSAAVPYQGVLSIKSNALQSEISQQTALSRKINIPTGVSEIVFEDLLLSETAKRWDEEEGNLHELTAALERCEAKTVSFGIRDFGDNGKGRLALNGRTIFLRSEANCAEFPETGHPPMTVEEWMDVLSRYRSYGINCMRFHSHCPPEAAFTAADKLGMLMQPELSHWNPKDAFESEESFAYYTAELKQILYMLANHPSFVMITLGNELHALELGHARMNQLIRLSHEIDRTRLIANGSNVHYGEIGCDAESDFYTTQKFYKEDVRGTFANMEGYINHQYPNAKTNYDTALAAIRAEYGKPIFSFEVGQFEILPDFDELADFKGISEPANYELIQRRVEERGLTAVWKRYVEATGELSRIGYREEIEAAMRTKELSGISLLGIQDFPGQGTALVGMLNSHLDPKPFDFAKPEYFRSFFRDQLPLLLLEKYTYVNTEILEAKVQIANFGKNDMCGVLHYELCGEGVAFDGQAEAEICCPMGQLTDAGKIQIALSEIKKPARLDLKIGIGDVTNSYPVWVYPEMSPGCPTFTGNPQSAFGSTEREQREIYQAEYLDAHAKKVLENGGIVYLSPASTREALPSSIQAQFTTDFWSVGTFAGQEGAMGQLIDAEHPLFENFPTEFHTNWQWWPMAVQRAVILPEKYKAIITEMDSYAFLRPMAQLLECRCLNGKVLFSTLGLQNLQQYPECRALLHAIYCYLESDKFEPEQTIAPEIIEALVKKA